MKRLSKKYIIAKCLVTLAGLALLLVIVSISMLVTSIGSTESQSAKEDSLPVVVVWLLLVGFIIFILSIVYIWAWLTWIFYKYEMDDDSLNIERGIISKHYVSINHSRIQNVNIYRSLIDRFLGLSQLMIQTAGDTGYNFSEGVLPGLQKEQAVIMRDDLMKRSKRAMPEHNNSPTAL